MSFKTLNIGATALMAQQIALNTVGHNVANASTPGYARQRVSTQANNPDIKTFGALGSGAGVKQVTRVADDFLEMQVRKAGTLFKYLETMVSAYENIETFFNELTDNDLSSDFDRFWSSLSDLNNNVEDVSTRRATIEQAQVLCDTFNGLALKIQDMRRRMDGNVTDLVSNINTLTTEIARLNADIVQTEKGGLSDVVANDSRDQRTERIRELAEILDITATEATNGSVNVSLRGRLLVFENQTFTVETEQVFSSGMLVHRPVFSSDKAELKPGEGQLGALLEIRDQILLSYSDDLDRLAGTFLWEFNRIHSQGQGLVGFSSATSTSTVISGATTLDQLQFEFNPLSGTYAAQNGNVEILVRNEITGEVTTANIEIDLDGVGDPDTVLYFDTNYDQFNSLSNVSLDGLNYGVNTGSNGQLYFTITNAGPNYTVNAYTDPALTNQVATGTIAAPNGTVNMVQVAGSGISGTIDINYTADDNTIVVADLFGNSFVQKVQNALDRIVPNTFTVSVDTNNRVTIDSASTSYTFGFGRDTSGVLAMLGFNTFFSGYDAGSIGIQAGIRANPQQVAAARDFEPGDNQNAVALLRLRETAVYDNGTSTVDDYYQGIVGRLGIEFSQKMSLKETQEDILLRAQNQREDLSGVNLDEELTKMIQYQRAFQSAARFISTADTIYETLINM